MKNEKELNEEIKKLTMSIKDNHPELSKYLIQIPISIPNNKK